VLVLLMVLDASVLLVTDGILQPVSVSVPKAVTPLPLDSALAFLWVSSRYWDLLDSSGGAAALLLSQ